MLNWHSSTLEKDNGQQNASLLQRIRLTNAIDAYPSFPEWTSAQAS
jgi:hypothetical protein